MRHHRFAPVALAFVCFVILASCAAVDAPRQSTRPASANPVAFESPRSEYVVEQSPDIGSVSFRGVVRGRSPLRQSAPANGHAFDVQFERNDVVEQGQVVLTFVPLPSDAELIDLEIAELAIDRATAAGDDAAVAEAQRDYDDLQASFDERAIDVRAETTGVIGSTRQNIRYPVDAGDVLFTVSDTTDLVVAVSMTADDWRSLPPEAAVIMVRSSGDTEDSFAGTLRPLDISESERASNASSDDEVTATIAFDAGADLGLGDRLAVSVAVEIDPDARWIPEQLVHRRDGQSFLLSTNAAGELSRLDVDLGRRTLTHVQVLSPLAVGTTLVAPQ